jgi:hypothetical protein
VRERQDLLDVADDDAGHVVAALDHDDLAGGGVDLEVQAQGEVVDRDDLAA